MTGRQYYEYDPGLDPEISLETRTEIVEHS
jgi:hypothetical protein